MKKYCIYKMRHDPTGMVYIGMTSGKFPFLRWADHVYGLCSGKNRCKILQEFWSNGNDDITAWSFSVIRTAFGGMNARHAEAESVADIPVEKRLNCPGTATITEEKKRSVIEMLGRGVKYKDISLAVGIAQGTISKIKNSHKRT